MMDRRQLLGGGVAAGLSIAVPNWLQAAFAPLTANDVQKRFFKAETIPEVARIDYLKTENAKRLMVVFRQIHLPPKEIVPSANDIWLAEQSQLEIYRAMDNLLDRNAPGFNHVMCEEYANGPALDFLNEWRQEYHNRLRALTPPRPVRRGGGFMPPGPMGNFTPLENRLDRRLGGVSTLGFVGAGKVMGFSRGIEILPAADLALEKQVDKEIACKDPRVYDYWVFNKREEMALQLAAQSKRLISYVIYGCNHKWELSIPKWNWEHKDDRFSAIIVTTNIVKKWEDWQEEMRK